MHYLFSLSLRNKIELTQMQTMYIPYFISLSNSIVSF